MTVMLEKTETKTTTEAPLELMRFSGERYDEMWKSGFITSDDRVELLDGQIVRKPEMNPRHLYGVKDIYDRVFQLFQNRAVTTCQSTIQLPQDGRPDPDITLFKLETPRDRLPLPEDIYLVIEVSDSTLARDRDVKLELYARDGITEYWIVNLEQNQLEVYRDPEGTRYASSFTVKNAIPTACLAFPDDPIHWT
jgi:Uma2 family endonuclease